ncbi:MAG: DUF1080 domain-containing protein [Pirellulales bacterium]|nr:DUF1080 domain-containing protein [Pirellulales bacterium]
MKPVALSIGYITCSGLVFMAFPTTAQVHPHHAEQIRKAANEVKPRSVPKKPRMVLIFNTPPHLMDKDPHKGYCIPYGEEGRRALGEASGAFKPVVNDDIAMFTPENIKQFDAIILNNTSFGHMASLYSNPQVLQFYLDAIQFAIGDLEAPMIPRKSRPVRKPVPGTQSVPGLEDFVSLFDGRTMEGWEGDWTIWSVRDGAITGQTTAETNLKENNFLIWKDQVENFELRWKFRMEGGKSGVYYRAMKRPVGDITGDPLIGTQADLDASGRWTGAIMEYLLRDVLAERGQKAVIDESGKKQVVGSLGDSKKLLEVMNIREWNDCTLIAKGSSAAFTINGVTMCELEDHDPKRLVHGWLALQVHAGTPMLVQYKNVYLRRF